MSQQHKSHLKKQYTHTETKKKFQFHSLLTTNTSQWDGCAYLLSTTQLLTPWNHSGHYHCHYWSSTGFWMVLGFQQSNCGKPSSTKAITEMNVGWPNAETVNYPELVVCMVSDRYDGITVSHKYLKDFVCPWVLWYLVQEAQIQVKKCRVKKIPIGFKQFVRVGLPAQFPSKPFFHLATREIYTKNIHILLNHLQLLFTVQE